MKKFVDVIVPLPIANQYTYSLPQEMEEMVQIGCRVVVPFGKKKFYTAIGNGTMTSTNFFMVQNNKKGGIQ